MNADSCRACHQDPVLGGAGGLELNVSRMAFDNGGQGPYSDVPGGQAFQIPAERDVIEQRFLVR